MHESERSERLAFLGRACVRLPSGVENSALAPSSLFKLPDYIVDTVDYEQHTEYGVCSYAMPIIIWYSGSP